MSVNEPEKYLLHYKFNVITKKIEAATVIPSITLNSLEQPKYSLEFDHDKTKTYLVIFFAQFSNISVHIRLYYESNVIFTETLKKPGNCFL